MLHKHPLHGDISQALARQIRQVPSFTARKNKKHEEAGAGLVHGVSAMALGLESDTFKALCSSQPPEDHHNHLTTHHYGLQLKIQPP